MESGNSSSMQSSSGGGNGGDDDFDSRPDSSSLPFFSSSSSSQPDHLPFNPNHNPSQQQQQPPLSALFDPPSADFAPYDTSSMLNPDHLLWAPNPQQFVGVSMSASTQLQQQHPDRDRDDAAAALMGSAGTAAGSTEGGGVQTRPKKRTRASRRAPTTVLATDTSNFRAMVQQYTGIPSSPYSAAVSSSSSPFTRRLDLIRSPFSGRGGGGGVGNLFRPAAHSQQQTKTHPSGAGAGSIFPFHNITCDENMGTRRDCRDVEGINIFANFNSSNNSFQSLSNTNPMAAALPRMPLGVDSLPQMTFQSLLSSQFSSMTYPSMVSKTAAAVTAGGSDVFGAQFNDQSIRVNNNSNIGPGVEDGLGVSHDLVGGFSGVGIGSDGTGPKNDKHDRGDSDNGGGNDGLATDGGKYAVNCGSSSSTTNLQRDQLVESAIAAATAANSRGEGTLASWINSPS